MADIKKQHDVVAAFLQDVSWKTLGKTFGNFHNTVIGMLVQTWTSVPSRRALEAPPAGKSRDNRKRYSDIILMDGDAPVGVVEVEGVKAATVLTSASLHFE